MLKAELRKPLTHRWSDRARCCKESSPVNLNSRWPSSPGAAQGKGGALASRLLLFLPRKINLCTAKPLWERRSAASWSVGSAHLLFSHCYFSKWHWHNWIPMLGTYVACSVCSQKLSLGMRQVSICVSLQRRCGGNGEERGRKERPAATDCCRSEKGWFKEQKLSLLGQKEVFQYSLIVKWFLFFKQCPTWMSLRSISASRSCCTGAKSTRLWPSGQQPPTPAPPRHQDHLHNYHSTGLCSDSLSQEEQELKNQLLITVWVEICSRLLKREDGNGLFSKKVCIQVHLTGT